MQRAVARKLIRQVSTRNDAGAKALYRGVREVFGERGLVQQCRADRLRHVLEHQPEEKPAPTAWVRAGLPAKPNEGTAQPRIGGLYPPIPDPQFSAARERKGHKEQNLFDEEFLCSLRSLAASGLLNKPHNCLDCQ